MLELKTKKKHQISRATLTHPTFKFKIMKYDFKKLKITLVSNLLTRYLNFNCVYILNSELFLEERYFQMKTFI